MAHFVYAVAFFLAAQVCIWWNNWLMEQMIRAINFQRTPDNQISSSFRNRSKTKLIESEYRRLYPQGRIETWRFVSLILGFACFLMTAVMFFRPNR
jgi:hypothetical protein